MGGEGRGTQIEISGRIPAARREDSTSRIQRVWGKLKEKLSGAHRLPDASVSDKTPIPASGKDGDYRMVCLQKMDGALGALQSGSPFWEHDFGTLMAKAKAGFNPEGDGSDYINQEICCRMMGVAIQMHEAGKLGLFANTGGAKYLKWGERNLMLPEMREICGKMLKKIAQLPEPPAVL